MQVCAMPTSIVHASSLSRKLLQAGVSAEPCCWCVFFPVPSRQQWPLPPRQWPGLATSAT